MANIVVLEKSVAELIAAGEVVERPASIVKELVENSIDAGATQITVEIKGGGIGYIRVSDNGHGINAEDVPTAFLRHATSKVRTVDDLEHIGTLGFRGEALASISAVSKVKITTKTAKGIEGTTYTVSGGEVDGPYPAGVPQGTSIIIRDVFYNVPARMKFLRKDISEGNAVAQIIDKCALSHPEIAFTFVRDTQTKLKTSGNCDLKAVIATIYGREFAADMLEVNYSFENRISVTGFISHPSNTKPSRTYQNFFINHRYVRTTTCSAALEQAFKGKLMVGRFPTCILNIEIEASQVDPNVHPAKIEVRFSDEKPIFNAVYYSIKNALTSLDSPLTQKIVHKTEVTPLSLSIEMDKPEQQRIDSFLRFGSVDTTITNKKSGFSDRVSFSSSTSRKIVPERNVNIMRTATQSAQILPASFDTIGMSKTISDKLESPKEALLPKQEVTPIQLPINMRFIGELFDTYILLQQGEEFLLVDKHAAHERIMYEKIRAGADVESNRQVLLTPIPVTLQRDEHAVLLENLDTVNQLGFLVEDFGTGTLIVRETPIALDGEDISYLLSELAGRLLKQQNDLTPEVLNHLFDSIACKAAIRAGDKNNPAELKEIVAQLTLHPQITHCPHGRPIVLRIPKKEIEKMFGRQG